MNKINIFCLPFAGGSRYSYNGYRQYARHVNIIPVEPPGRGSRFAEPLLDNIYDMVDDVYEQVKNSLFRPYAIYGHSMGAMLGFLLTRRILQEGLPEPLQLFLTGRAAPSTPKKEAPLHRLPKEEFFEALKALGGCPEELLSNDELKEFFEPIIRADLQVVDSYSHEPFIPFDIPVTVMIGMDEDISFEEALAWQKETNVLVSVRKFTGDHFFIYDHEREIVNMMSSLTAQKLKTASYGSVAQHTEVV